MQNIPAADREAAAPAAVAVAAAHAAAQAEDGHQQGQAARALASTPGTNIPVIRPRMRKRSSSHLGDHEARPQRDDTHGLAMRSSADAHGSSPNPSSNSLGLVVPLDEPRPPSDNSSTIIDDARASAAAHLPPLELTVGFGMSIPERSDDFGTSVSFAGNRTAHHSAFREMHELLLQLEYLHERLFAHYAEQLGGDVPDNDDLPPLEHE